MTEPNTHSVWIIVLNEEDNAGESVDLKKKFIISVEPLVRKVDATVIFNPGNDGADPILEVSTTPAGIAVINLQPTVKFTEILQRYDRAS